ncbi:MAG: hypothetical protein INH41_01380 [Myxococcaceae bacterium]|nr:hypothetical protein [Myxococcaceae bacterium]
MGAVGAMGAPGQPGPAGPPGAPGPLIVIAAADGGALAVDGGLVIVTGPQGSAGPTGPMGAPGPLIVIAAADGGAVAVDGGLVIVTGPQGPAGPPGPMGQTLLVLADGGSVSFDGGLAVVSGAPGPQGAPGQSVVGSSEPPGANCAAGGVRLVSVSGAAFVCNGAQGAAGQSVGFSVEPPGASCAAGGVRLIGALGTSIVCNGPSGPQGAQGLQGQPGQALFILTADGGGAVVDGGVVVVAGPRGLSGQAGPPGGIRVIAPDGGLLGYHTGSDYYSVRAGCFVGLNGFSPIAVGPTAVGRICWTGPSCTGTPLMPSAFLRVSFGAASSYQGGYSALGRCFLGYRRATGSMFEGVLFRLANPLRRGVATLLSCSESDPNQSSSPGPVCSPLSVPLTEGLELEEVPWEAAQPLTDLDGLRIEP